MADRWQELWLRTGEHIMLTGVSTGFAIVFGVPLGIFAARVHWLRGFVLSVVGITQTVPSLAMLAILLTLLGKIGTLPAIIALTLYALLPIVRNTVTGLEAVSPGIMEAARGIGMTGRQQLWMVQLPLAMPVMISGIRTAAVIGVGIATLSAFIGAGGLGQFINSGISLANPPLIMLGAIPAAILALVVDFCIGATEWALRPMRQLERKSFKGKMKPLALALPVILAVLGAVAYFTGSVASRPAALAGGQSQVTIRVATKDFTEQFIIGELMAQLIEAHPGFNVERRFNLGGTMICHGALIEGEVDLYAEYTGTGLISVLKHAVIVDPDKALAFVRAQYRRKLNLEWLEPFGFNNTYAITVRRKDVERHGWKTISDLAAGAAELRAGFTSEFAEREDGYPGLRQAYGFTFGTRRDLNPAIMYEAVAKEEVDVICAFATDGRIAAYDLVPLRDDRNFFPPYYAAPVVRMDVLEAHPELRQALQPLAGLLDDATMQQLNYQVDKHKRRPREVAKKFLQARDLIKG